MIQMITFDDTGFKRESNQTRIGVCPGRFGEEVECIIVGCLEMGAGSFLAKSACP